MRQVAPPQNSSVGAGNKCNGETVNLQTLVTGAVRAKDTSRIPLRVRRPFASHGRFAAFAIALVIGAPAVAADFYAWLVVRYPEKAVRTFLQAPYASKARCERSNQATWDNVITACGTCSVEVKQCAPLDELPDLFRKTLRQEPAAFPYVVANQKARIITSGVPTSYAIEECHRLAGEFKAGGYPEARCVLR